MKRFFFLVCVVLCLSTSCEKHPGPKTPGFQIMDANWNDTLRVAATFLVSKSFEFHVGLKLQASLDEPFVYGLNPRTVFLDDYAEHYHKPAELFRCFLYQTGSREQLSSLVMFFLCNWGMVLIIILQITF